MSILSFAEFKNEVRQMKLEWQKEAAKWNWFTGESLTTRKVGLCFLLVHERVASLIMSVDCNRKPGHSYDDIVGAVCAET
jgi:hypothetical protein